MLDNFSIAKKRYINILTEDNRIKTIEEDYREFEEDLKKGKKMEKFLIDKNLIFPELDKIQTVGVLSWDIECRGFTTKTEIIDTIMALEEEIKEYKELKIEVKYDTYTINTCNMFINIRQGEKNGVCKPDWWYDMNDGKFDYLVYVVMDKYIKNKICKIFIFNAEILKDTIRHYLSNKNITGKEEVNYVKYKYENGREGFRIKVFEKKGRNIEVDKKFKKALYKEITPTQDKSVLYNMYN